MTIEGGRIEELFDFFTEIGIIAQLNETAIQRQLPEGMSHAQFALLHHLCRLGGEWTPARLAEALQVTRGAITNTVKRLETKRFVLVRAAGGDGRSKLVSLTEAGLAARNDALARLVPEVRELSGELPLPEISATLPVLKAVRKVLDGHR
ncbi:MAG: MarR family winged helix-turn-helix transcriptional regulator [Rhizobiaceae bacterium]|jgi:DNA-binding MarR family transcriptional regulator